MQQLMFILSTFHLQNLNLTMKIKSGYRKKQIRCNDNSFSFMNEPIRIFLHLSNLFLSYCYKQVDNQAEILFSEVLKSLREIAEKQMGLGPLDSNTEASESRHQIDELEGILQKEKLEFEVRPPMVLYFFAYLSLIVSGFYICFTLV